MLDVKVRELDLECNVRVCRPFAVFGVDDLLDTAMVGTFWAVVAAETGD